MVLVPATSPSAQTRRTGSPGERAAAVAGSRRRAAARVSVAGGCRMSVRGTVPITRQVGNPRKAGSAPVPASSQPALGGRPETRLGSESESERVPFGGSGERRAAAGGSRRGNRKTLGLYVRRAVD